MEQIDRELYKIGAAVTILLLMIAIAVWIFKIDYTRFLIPCMFQRLTGLYCPGCGGTRAVKAFFRGDILASIMLHPLVVYGSGLFIWYMFSNTIQLLSGDKLRIGMKYRNLYVWIGVLLIAANCIIKNIMILSK